jgi:hypothetical protein
MLTIHFTTPLGAQISITTENEMQTLREYGAKGWTSGDVVKMGGLKLPLLNHDNFDWALIGARASEIRNAAGENEPGVWYRGNFYKKRNLEAVKNKKMELEAAIKYSRGARDNDPPEIRERSGEFEYVTLILFRGRGHLKEYDQK